MLITSKKETKNSLFKSGLLNGYIRHLFSGRINEFGAKKYLNVALSHFSHVLLSQRGVQNSTLQAQSTVKQDWK